MSDNGNNVTWTELPEDFVIGDSSVKVDDSLRDMANKYREDRNKTKTDEKKDKKKQKFYYGIYRQLVVPMVVIMLFMGVSNIIFLLFEFSNKFIQNKAADISGIASEASNAMKSFASISALVPYWIEHGTEMEHIFDVKGMYEQYEELYSLWPEMPEMEYVSDELFEAQSEEVKKKFAEAAYSRMCKEFSDIKTSFQTKYLYTLVEVDGNLYYLVTGLNTGEKHTSAGGYVFELGDTLPYVPGDYRVLDEVLRTHRPVDKLDHSTDFFSDPSTVHLFVPLYGDDGEYLAVIGVAMDRVHLINTGLNIILNVILVDVIVFSLLALLFIYLVRWTVLYPVLRTEEAVLHYEETKNAEEVEKKLKAVKSFNEIEVLAGSFGSMIKEVEQYIVDITTISVEKERIDTELNLAAQIQAGMLPSIFPPYPDRTEFELYATMDPAKEVAGDFYDFFLVDQDHLALVIADVSGKGVPASLFMMIGKTLLKMRSLGGGDLSDIAYDVNNQLCENNKNELFVTVWMAIVDLKTGDGVSINAGHEHPSIGRKGEGYEVVKYRHSTAFGIMEGVTFSQREFHLDPGDTIFVYTDGVAEATDKDGNLFGTDRMLESLDATQDEPVDKIIEGVQKSIDEFVGDAEQFDDITMLAFRYFGA